jgi:hypothetical protein
MLMTCCLTSNNLQAVEDQRQRRQVSTEVLLVELQKGETSVIPELREIFSKTSIVGEKQRIASALLAAGVKDDSYFALLLALAKKAIENDMPFPTQFDSKGKTMKRTYTKEFVHWCQERKKDVDTASRDAIYTLPMDVTYLAKTGDIRAKETLTIGLRSKNFFIVFNCARGLALLRETAAVDMIIESCRTAPAEAGQLIGMALFFFDDARAQKAATQYVGDQALIAHLRGLFRDLGPKGVFAF